VAGEPPWLSFNVPQHASECLLAGLSRRSGGGQNLFLADPARYEVDVMRAGGIMYSSHPVNFRQPSQTAVNTNSVVRVTKSARHRQEKVPLLADWPSPCLGKVTAIFRLLARLHLRPTRTRNAVLCHPQPFTPRWLTSRTA
jgi:hypothetical protein